MRFRDLKNGETFEFVHGSSVVLPHGPWVKVSPSLAVSTPAGARYEIGTIDVEVRRVSAPSPVPTLRVSDQNAGALLHFANHGPYPAAQGDTVAVFNENGPTQVELERYRDDPEGLCPRCNGPLRASEPHWGDEDVQIDLRCESAECMWKATEWYKLDAVADLGYDTVAEARPNQESVDELVRAAREILGSALGGNVTAAQWERLVQATRTFN